MVDALVLGTSIVRCGGSSPLLGTITFKYGDNMKQVYLSRQNLKVLLSKLNRRANGENTPCTIIKRDDTHPNFPQSMPRLMITSIEEARESNSERVYLSRYELSYLVGLLDNNQEDTLEKEGTTIIPIEDEKYYTHRSPGYMLPRDMPVGRKSIH